MVGLAIELKFDERKLLTGVARKLAYDRALYTDMILSAYQAGIDAAFRTQGFGGWRPMKPGTIAARQKGQGYYGRSPRNFGRINYPANIWSATMRDTIAGRKVRSFNPLQFGKGEQNIRFRTNLSHARHALRLRPLSSAILKGVIQIMSERMKVQIVKNVKLAVRNAP